jgi:hypothetical protein
MVTIGHQGSPGLDPSGSSAEWSHSMTPGVMTPVPGVITPGETAAVIVGLL